MWTFPRLRALGSFFPDKKDARQSKIVRKDIDTALMTERVLTPPLDPITAPVRSNAVDIVKGLAILLVTYEHTAQGMSSRGWWNGPSRFYSNLFVYSFHMPAFFFLAGLFVVGSIHRRGPKNFILDKMKTLLYLYLFWAVLLSAIEPLISRFKNSPHTVDWKSFPISLINGGAGWFFPVLFLCLMLALLTVKLPAWLRLAVAVVAAAMLPTFGYEVFYKTVWHFSFLAGGMFVGRAVFKLSAIPRWIAALLAIVVFALQAAVVFHFGGPAEFEPPASSSSPAPSKTPPSVPPGHGSARPPSVFSSWHNFRRALPANSCYALPIPMSSGSSSSFPPWSAPSCQPSSGISRNAGVSVGSFAGPSAKKFLHNSSF
jgi:hypothetical protein